MTHACAVQEKAVMERFGFLYGGYSFPYWETIDMSRKLVIGGIPVFIAVQALGSLQAVIGEVISGTQCTSAINVRGLPFGSTGLFWKPLP